jgi:tetratricopeptide (TPR) repeat protein
MISGEEPRILAVVEAVNAAVVGWKPPPELLDTTRQALGIIVTNAMVMMGPARPENTLALLHELGPGEVPVTRVVLAQDPFQPGDVRERLVALADDPDRRTAMMALQYLGHQLENEGDAEGTTEVLARALDLWREEDGPWTRAMLEHAQAQIFAQRGERELAAEYAKRAMPVLDALEAGDDAIQVRALLASSAFVTGDLAEAERLYNEILTLERGRATFSGSMMTMAAQAELQIAHGDHVAGLLTYRRVAHEMSTVRFPGVPASGLEPWTMFGLAGAVTAYARYGHGDEGADLAAELNRKTPRLLDPAYTFLDYPVCGMIMFALGCWGLMRGSVPARDAIRMLVVAERFSYNRFAPTLDWDSVAAVAEIAAPGEIDAVRAEWGDRRGPALLEEARALVKRMSG